MVSLNTEKSYVLILAKMGWATFWSDFFAKSSGRPGDTA
jgi:hypothetical protein